MPLLLPRQASQSAGGPGADALLRLRLAGGAPGPGRRLAASAASGLLLAAAFPPLDLGPLALVALVPLLWAWRDAGPAGGALYGGVAGVVFFAVLVSWTRYFGFVAIVPLVAFLALWWALTGAA